MPAASCSISWETTAVIYVGDSEGLNELLAVGRKRSRLSRYIKEAITGRTGDALDRGGEGKEQALRMTSKLLT